ncbi:MAG: amidoligase family protein [Thermodesulfobacteriota bacterium]
MEGSASLAQGEQRLKERYPMLRYFTERPFGIEIEFFGLKYSISAGDREAIPPYKIMNRTPEGVLLPQLFQQRGITLNGFSPSDPPYEAWSFVTDDSIKGAGGSELVSPILSGVQGLIRLYQVLNLLQEFPEIQVNDTCGFHVHHGVDPETFGNQELFQLMRIVAIFENYIYHLLPEDRRGAETCRPLEIDLYKWFRRNGSERQVPLVKNLWYSLENRDDAQTPRHRKIHPTRYHGLNLHSYWYRGTVEFRYYPSILDQPEELMQWIIFTQFLMEWSAGRRPELEFVPNPNKWLNTLYKIYLGAGMLDHIRFPGSSGGKKDNL